MALCCTKLQAKGPGGGKKNLGVGVGALICNTLTTPTQPWDLTCVRDAGVLASFQWTYKYVTVSFSPIQDRISFTINYHSHWIFVLTFSDSFSAPTITLVKYHSFQIQTKSQGQSILSNVSTYLNGSPILQDALLHHAHCHHPPPPSRYLFTPFQPAQLDTSPPP